MNLSKLVHDIRPSSKIRSHTPSDYRITVYQTRAFESCGQEMASVLTPSPYANQPSVYARSPQPPPSPPIEDPNCKCTLPSISSLIGMSNAPASNHEQQRRSPVRFSDGIMGSSPSLQPKSRKLRLRSNSMDSTRIRRIFDRRIPGFPA